MSDIHPVPDAERLVQRFIDQELSSEERVQFVVRLGRDAALREQVIALEELVLVSGRLPRPAVPEGFVAGVLGRLPEAAPVRAPSAWRRLAGLLTMPRTFEWNMAGAAAVLLVVAAAGGVMRLWPGPAGTTAPQATALVLVRLVIVEPNARSVHAVGDFNAWNPSSTPLEPATSGAWTVTLPLEPGRYQYMFVVDGQRWVVDPFAIEQSDDGFGARNAVLDVRPPAGQPL